MRRNLRKLLFDINQACQLLQQFTAGRNLNDYLTDAMLRSAVERQFEIIGEALNQLLRAEPTLSEHISHSGRIIAFRNRLIHGYATIADEVVWGVLENYLPRLSREVSTLLPDTNQ